VPFALAEGVEMESLVAAQFFAVGIDDVAGMIGNVVSEEVAHFHGTDEADALAVFFAGDGKCKAFCDGTDFRFEHFACGKKGVADLKLGHEREEIALVFVRIGSAQDGGGSIAEDAASRIVTGANMLKTLAECVVEEHAEFHFAIAPDIRIGRDAAAVAFDEVVDDAFTVGIDEVDDPKLDAEVFCDRVSVFHVLLPGAIPGNALRVDPVFHVATDDFVALFEQ